MELEKLISRIRNINEDIIVDPDELDSLSAVKNYVSTQVLPLDLAIGHRGIPCGRVTLIYGPESEGKSTLATHILAETQRRGGLAILFDTEFSFDKAWAERIGIEYNSLVHVQPETMEQVFEHLNKIIDQVEEARKSGNDPGPVVVVWDSIAATPVNVEMEKKDKFYDMQPGQQARVMSTSLRKIVKRIAENEIALVLVNQLRDNIGVMYGPKESIPCGRALRFYSSLSIKVRKQEILYDNKIPIGIGCEARIEKNKIGAPFKRADFSIMFDMNQETGIDLDLGYFNAALSLGILKQGGGWYEFADKSIHPNKFRASEWKKVLSSELKDVIEGLAWREPSAVVGEGDIDV